MQLDEFCDAGTVAQSLGVKGGDVTKWADSPTPNFPLPCAVLRLKGGKRRPLWKASQIPDLREWLAGRLDLSDPAAHWAMVDRGEEQPGGHQDQMAMFSVESKTANEEPAGLFSL